MSTPEEGNEAEREGTPAGKKRGASTNAIELVGVDTGSAGGAGSHPVRPAEPAEVKPARKRKGKNAEATVTAAATDARRDVIPDTVQSRFIQVGKQFYFPDGAEAFVDQGQRLTTRSENAVVVQSMVAIAQARGATELAVSGSEFFRKEAWFAARVAGLEVRGYKPTELEQERVARAIGRRETAARGEAGDANAVEASTKQPGTAAPRPDDARRSAPAGDLIVGRLVDHGVAPFQHRPDRAMSYYVRLETDHGEVEQWGRDLERALRQSLSRPGIGDEVGLRKVGSEPVTVREVKRDEGGREIGQEAKSARRNQWVLEKKEFLDERAQMGAVFRDANVSAAEAVRRHPELEGSYEQLQLGQAMVEQRFASKLHREQFVEHLRGYLARQIEQGQPLDPVSVRSRRSEQVEPRVHDRDYQPVR